MNKYFLYAASVFALASCSSDDFLGENSGNGQNAANSVINFGGETGKITRAADGTSVGAKAADLLGETFYVLGTKGTLPDNSPTTSIVFDNYKVVWKGNTAGTTDDNTNDWRYVGVDPTGLHAGSEITKQTIKYWDYSASQYDFIAYSVGKNKFATSGEAVDGTIVGTVIKTPTTDNDLSYTLKGKKIEDLQKCYYTDVTTVKNEGIKNKYSKPVTFTFKNLTAKVRVAFYETIPGYTVSGIEFYKNTTTDKGNLTNQDAAVLFTTDDYKLSTSGTIKVTYPKVGGKNTSDKAYNKAFVSVVKGADEETTTELGLGEVHYNEQGFLNTTAKEANMAGPAGDNYFTPVLPAEGHALTLRLNYTLTSTDGSGETIKVYGATAVVPASYTAWQPNYAYTYIFKISDNTNGTTSTTTDKVGLFPITFDAVVADVDNVDFNHESITTVSTPSVTSYAYNSHDKKVILARGVGNEYPASANTEIYFSVYEKGATKTDLNDNGQLYTVTKNDATGNPVADLKVTEAEVIDALQIQESEDVANKTITGRNGIVLKGIDTNTNITEIPTDDGKTVPVDAHTTAMFKAETAATYAYVYKNEDGTPSDIYTAVTFAEGSAPKAQANEYYMDPSNNRPVAAGITLTAGTTYYKKYTNNNNVYGVKVVKTYK